MELWAILAEKVSADPHVKNLPDIVDPLDTAGILISAHYNLRHANFHLGCCLGWIVGELGCSVSLKRNSQVGSRNEPKRRVFFLTFSLTVLTKLTFIVWKFCPS